MNKTINTLIMGAALFCTSVSAETVSNTEAVVQHHMEAAASRDMSALISDYTDDAFVITDGEVVRGKLAIEKMFEQVFAGDGTALTVTKSVYEGNTGFIAWRMGDALQGSDTFIVEDGKIVVQTVVLMKK